MWLLIILSMYHGMSVPHGSASLEFYYGLVEVVLIEIVEVMVMVVVLIICGGTECKVQRDFITVSFTDIFYYTKHEILIFHNMRPQFWYCFLI